MLTNSINVVYKRLLVLSLLLGCLIVFSSSDFIERVYAAPCIQDCETYEAQCYDECVTSCGLTDLNCNGCITACNDDFRNCIRHAVWCEDGTAENGRCSVEFGTHINDSTGVGHSGYYQICEGLGGQDCQACPEGETCPGAGGLPPVSYTHLTLPTNREV